MAEMLIETDLDNKPVILSANALHLLVAQGNQCVEKIEAVETEARYLRDDLEKMRIGYMTILTKLEHQEGVIAQLQLELQSYRMSAQKSGQSGQVDSGQMSSGQLHAPTAEVRATGGHSAKNVHPKTYSSRVKGEVIRHYAETYPKATHVEIAAHFDVSTKTVQRALKGGVTQ